MEKLSRRSFLKSTSLGMTFLATQAYSQGFSNLIFENKKQNNIKLDYVIYDKDIKRSKEFAKKMLILGTKTYEIDKDVSQLWREVIKPTWGYGKDASIAGLTSYETMFVLEKIAFDNGMLMYFNAEHNIQNGNVNNNLNLSNKKTAKDLKRYSLTDALALNFTQYPYERISSNSNIFANKEENKNNEILYSWIIAPRKVS
ncbi:hypothetical protein CPU12_03740 [Malaciobacter molluscorum LMG 25693]|uniref:Uncharacterized protein n=1 Tax=Malaciobacter molluscorum LMG 25693 TaxID=870501 RepID=A0A2G1DJL8_9BACT|nr:hypothetical protein [Malaciobacter molluscorum]AXX92849.1 hypothetical protein AMOL_1886 [Malaciobacter molluscorum LMG 25693]PHO18688.1 hypothetical protein CPU12_03740 [Malaciobacter molluscorum LMG 25693]